MAEKLLDRSLYKKIKRMDRDSLEDVLREFYDMGRKSVTKTVFDMNELMLRIGKVKGIGESRLKEIMDIIEKYIDEGANNEDDG